MAQSAPRISRAIRVFREALHLPTPMRTEDRRVLEQVIFPYYRSRSDIRSVLFVGCQWYTRHYERAFFAGCDYWTIEPSSRARKYGGRQHVVAPMEQLDLHFPEGSFDCVICNGVYGFGLDTLDQGESAFAHAFSRLRPGGHLMLGWNDLPALKPFPLEELESLRRFERFSLPAFGTWRYVTATPHRHVYDFYTRPAA
jgi:SAM-dependent methyltransferase